MLKIFQETTLVHQWEVHNTKVLPLYADHVIRFRTHFEESTKRTQRQT